MRDDLDRLLCTRYPELFARRHNDPMKTTMGWGFTCDNGWFDLIDELCAAIQARVDGGIEQPVCGQVKEKFGQLRFYLQSGATPELLELISRAVDRSAEICEVCGQPGVLMRNPGVIQTVCARHADPEATRVDLSRLMRKDREVPDV